MKGGDVFHSGRGDFLMELAEVGVEGWGGGLLGGGPVIGGPTSGGLKAGQVAEHMSAGHGMRSMECVP